MDESIQFRDTKYGAWNNFGVFSSQVFAYDKDEVEDEKGKINSAGRSNRQLGTDLALLATMFSYQIGFNDDMRGVWDDLSRITVKNLIKMYDIFSRSNLPVSDIYACTTVGRHVKRYISDSTERLAVSKEIYKKITVVDRKILVDRPELEPHYHIKELVGDYAKEDGRKVMSRFLKKVGNLKKDDKESLAIMIRERNRKANFNTPFIRDPKIMEALVARS